MGPVVSMVAEQQKDVDFYYVDVDESPELATRFGVLSIPTLIKILDGKETNRSVGAIPEAEVKQFVQS
ncbi:thioredoxin family protein [Aneurinibacillus sp. Ricciae_BoGa-3]|uniref:thioredoxin family protein n=1 Tax=Aneurinibacillus sp. Ricciae_BoGa-3 TaxID=3022697 RepID=UPI002341902C|nr:thioredoxin family protein [Aneurinibacillus sp. Ricciae_BoGa-3]WCK56372.1 thioredoxin family protein [Aneurinibacillus sp. Ricciae_BoGa-3]